MKKSLYSFLLHIILLTNIIFSSVVINELMIQPVNNFGEQFSEYIELYNYSNEDIDLQGWRLYNSFEDLSLPSLVINANSYLTIGMTNNTNLNNGMTFDYEWGIGDEFLINLSHVVMLYDNNNNLIDIINYDAGPYSIIEGASIELNNPFNDNNLGDNWSSGVSSYDNLGVNLGSPGIENSNYLGVPELTYSDLDFGVTQFGTETTIPVTLVSSGGSSVTISDLIDNGNQYFSYVTPNFPITLQPNDIFTLDITFNHETPNQQEVFDLHFVTDALPLNTISVYVTAEAGTPQIYIPQDIDFNDTEAMLTDTSSVFVGNSGTYTLNLSSASLVGDDLVADFEILSDFPIAILPGESQPIDIKFSPSESNTYNMTLNIEHDDFYYQIDNSTYEYNFTATSVAPSIELDTENIIFPTIHEGEQATYALSVSNTGTGDLNVSDVTFDNNVFSVESTSFTVNEGQSYLLDINFNPISMGTITGIMTITSNGHNTTTNTVSLTGEVVSGTLVLVPTDFVLIQDAINYAQEGDTVLVSPGTYDQSFSFNGKAVTVLGQEGAENTFLGLPDNENLILEDSFNYGCYMGGNNDSCGYWSYWEQYNYNDSYVSFSTSEGGRMHIKGCCSGRNYVYSPGFNHNDYDEITITFTYRYDGDGSNNAWYSIRDFNEPNTTEGSFQTYLNMSNETVYSHTITSEQYDNWEMMQLSFVNNGSSAPNLYIYNISIEGQLDGETRDLYQRKDIVRFESGENEGSILKGFTIQPGEFPSLTTRGVKVSNSSSPIIENLYFAPSIYQLYIQEENIWDNSNVNNYYGRAIFIEGSTPTFNNITIDSSIVTSFTDEDTNGFRSSGPLYIKNSDPIFNNLVISNSGQTTLVESNFHGGAAYIEDSNALFNNSTFTNNISFSNYSQGGAFHISNSSDNDYNVTFNECLFDSNSSYNGGGAIYIEGNTTTLNINESILSNNLTENSGGALSTSNANVNISESFLSNNSSENSLGGAIYNYNSYMNISESTLNNNSAHTNGGGLASISANLFINDSNFNDNTSIEYGGALYIGNNCPTVQLFDTEFRRNQAIIGGAIYENGVTNLITERLLIANNNALTKGGGMYFTYYDPIFTNITLANNTATYQGSGLYCEGSSDPVILNSIIWGNQSADGAHIYLEQGSELILNYNNIHSGASGIIGFDDIIYNNNISLDPAFTDSQNEDYTLHITSPCIDSGNPNSAYDPDDTLADMGYIFFDQITNNPGCMDDSSQNYDPDANVNLGCIYGPSFISIYDTPEDQGGYVFLNWNANTLDILPNTDILNYSVWRHIPDERGWEHLGDVPASYETSYGFTAPTINTTAVDGDTLYTTYKIKAHTSEQNEFFESQEGLGFSLDNIVPSTPDGLFGNYSEGGIIISWDESPDLDLSYYALYRENEYIGTSATNSYTDIDILQPPINYSIAAYDMNNNISEYSETYMYTSDIFGDISQDYIVNVLDIIVLVNIIFDTYMGGETPPDYILESSDINQDGIINILDVVSIVNIIMDIANSR